ncbi:MAG: hypothetical protein M5U09_18925 [Gammaproteobacteria bacterium]|nr:hypothetical protein [Gammaproteobacteria bacterium]
MDNQHRQIKGYRDLSRAEIDAMNRVKDKAAEVGALLDDLGRMESVDPRWLAIARTDLQKGFMSATRAVAKPDFF